MKEEETICQSLCLFVCFSYRLQRGEHLKEPKSTHHVCAQGGVNGIESGGQGVARAARAFLVRFAMSLKSPGFTRSFWLAHSQHMF